MYLIVNLFDGENYEVEDDGSLAGYLASTMVSKGEGDREVWMDEDTLYMKI